MLLVLLLSSRAAFIRYEEPFLMAGFVLTGALWFHSRLKIPAAAIAYLGLGLLWILVLAFIDQRFILATGVGHFLRLGVGVFVLVLLGARVFTLFPLWVALLALVGLPLYALGRMAPEVMTTLYTYTPDALKFFGGTIIDGRLDSGLPRASWLVYTVSPTRLTQNPGFMWEPAAFAMMTVSALTLRLISGARRLDWQNAVLLLATLTTVSTTGYIALALPLTYWAVTTQSKVLLLALPLLALGVLNLDFIVPKIVAEFQNSDLGQVRWSLSRYGSFLRDMDLFARAPILGTGLFYDPGYDSNNGFSDYLRRFGLLWFLVSTGLLFAAMRRVAPLAGALLFIAVVLLFSWSEKFFELPFYYMLGFAAFLPARQPEGLADAA